MKIGIISDTHGSLTAWQSAVEFWGNLDMIVHAGDVLYHGPRNSLMFGFDPKGLATIMNQSKIPIMIAQGNCDSEVDRMVIDWPLQGPFVFLQQSGWRIMIEHGHVVGMDLMLDMAKKFHANILVTGHTHIPVLERIDGIVVINPGSAALPKQPDGEGTAALFDGGEVKIFRLSDGIAIKKLRAER